MWSFSSINPLAHKGGRKGCHLQIECREESMQNKNRNCRAAQQLSTNGINVVVKCPESEFIQTEPFDFHSIYGLNVHFARGGKRAKKKTDPC